MDPFYIVHLLNKVIYLLDEDTHYDEICGYLDTISKEDTIILGVALGLNVSRLEGDDGIIKMHDTYTIVPVQIL